MRLYSRWLATRDIIWVMNCKMLKSIAFSRHPRGYHNIHEVLRLKLPHRDLACLRACSEKNWMHPLSPMRKWHAFRAPNCTQIFFSIATRPDEKGQMGRGSSQTATSGCSLAGHNRLERTLCSSCRACCVKIKKNLPLRPPTPHPAHSNLTPLPTSSESS